MQHAMKAGLVLALLSLGATQRAQAEESRPDLAGLNVLIVLPPGDFRDEEYTASRAMLDRCAAAVAVASTGTDHVTGMLGLGVTTDLDLADAKADDYDAVVLIGGVGAVRYFHHKDVHALVRQAVEGDKIVAAICLAPVILANAGVLRERDATVYPTKREELRKRGARVKTEPVVVDGRLITGNGPKAADAFAQALVEALSAVKTEREKEPDTEPTDTP